MQVLAGGSCGHANDVRLQAMLERGLGHLPMAVPSLNLGVAGGRPPTPSTMCGTHLNLLPFGLSMAPTCVATT